MDFNYIEETEEAANYDQAAYEVESVIVANAGNAKNGAVPEYDSVFEFQMMMKKREMTSDSLS